MKTYSELKNAYDSSVEVLRQAIEHAMHEPGCPSNLTPPVSFDEDMKTCKCWVIAADRHIRPGRYEVSTNEVYYSMNEGPECKCNHHAGSHSSGGSGLCTQINCPCMKYQRKQSE